MTDPLVGITALHGEFGTFFGRERLHTIDDFYVDGLVAAGMRPLILPNGLDPAVAGDMVAPVDGLVLSGGGDIDPVVYGAPRRSVRHDDIDVDRFELALVEEARRRRIPVLAICRGMQLLNVAQGGTLHQEVTSPGGVHVPIGDDPDEIGSRRHPVHLTPGGLLASLFGTTEIEVNSGHHQGVDRLGEGLTVEAVAPDGLVEGVRFSGEDWWALGVQWHPERLDRGHPQLLFAALRRAVETGR